MASKKQDKSVAGMAVLKDIRGLLTGSRDTVLGSPPGLQDTSEYVAEIKRLQDTLRDCQEQARAQKEIIDRLQVEKTKLEAGLKNVQGVAIPSANKGHQSEVADLQNKKDELTSALSEIEALLDLKVKELTRRIARIYEEAGDSSAGRDFRKINNQLESSANFGEFLRTLLR
jgi:hypothetical protein